MPTFKAALAASRVQDLMNKEGVTGDDLIKAILAGPGIREVFVLTENILKNTLKSEGLSNTGKSGEITVEVGLDGINIYAAYYLYILEEGAKYSSKMPPVDDIQRWVEQKGIGGNDPRSVAFAIAKSIQKKGLEPHPGLLDQMREGFLKEFKEAAAKNLKAAILGMFKKHSDK
jgi:hypothetical protein